ncbi:hypothetical protein Tco_0639491 [Tanacetum coccineum]
MANLEFCDTHNMVSYLKKIEGSEGFQPDKFLNTATARTLDNGEIEITATIDGKVKIVSEASIRRHLKLKDSDGISNLPTTEIFEQLALMGNTAKTEAEGRARTMIRLNEEEIGGSFSTGKKKLVQAVEASFHFHSWCLVLSLLGESSQPKDQVKVYKWRGFPEYKKKQALSTLKNEMTLKLELKLMKSLLEYTIQRKRDVLLNLNKAKIACKLINEERDT